jgi:hypothetical protein
MHADPAKIKNNVSSSLYISVRNDSSVEYTKGSKTAGKGAVYGEINSP